MKKVLLAFAVTAIFAACGDSSTDSSTTTDSTNVTSDTSTVSPVTVDTTSTMTDTSGSRMGTDTTRR